MAVASPPNDATPAGFPYEGPTTVATLHLAGRAIRLARPVEPDRLLDDPAVHDRNRRDDYMPYWAYLWPGAGMLAEAVITRWGDAQPGDDEVLELGCGLGLGGLAAMSLGFRVRFSDYNPATFGFIHLRARKPPRPRTATAPETSEAGSGTVGATRPMVNDSGIDTVTASWFSQSNML